MILVGRMVRMEGMERIELRKGRLLLGETGCGCFDYQGRLHLPTSNSEMDFTRLAGAAPASWNIYEMRAPLSLESYFPTHLTFLLCVSRDRTQPAQR